MLSIFSGRYNEINLLGMVFISASFIGIVEVMIILAVDKFEDKEAGGLQKGNLVIMFW